MHDADMYEQMRDFLENGKEVVFFDNPFIGITITDGKGTMLCVSPSQSRITGMDRDLWLGRNVYDLVAEGTMINSGTIQVLETGRPGTVRQTLSNGKSFFVQGYPIHDEQGVLRYVLNYLIDVSEINELKEELHKVKSENLEIARKLDSLQSALSRENSLIYVSKRIQALVHTIDLVADSDTTVLITGASGVGKEMIARTLHEKSPRRDRPFMKISCEAIPAPLLESELFGYEPGAFTGADAKGKSGLFEEGNQGTIFLDEIGEIPPALQVKLLQVLQEHAVRRIGGTKKIPVDIRVIAATNADVRGLIKERKFREDLFYRLNVIPIHVPGLEERREDIPLLARHFLDMFNKKYSRNKRFALNAVPYLAGLKYEGNIRQLRNLIERAILLSPEDVISIEDIDLVHDLRDDRHGEQAAGGEERPLKDALEERERELLQASWARHRNTHAIARALKVSQPTISRKLKKYRISAWPGRGEG